MIDPKTIYIENMVCDRCKNAVRQITTNLGWRVERLELGRLTGRPPKDDPDMERLAHQLSSIGFRLREGSGGTTSRIKGLIIQYVYDDLADASRPLSVLITEDIGQSYPHLSRLFSRLEGRTIVDFYRAHRIERGKRLLVETTEQISLIATRLHYGTAGRFAAAFREDTGFTPTAFRERGRYEASALDGL